MTIRLGVLMDPISEINYKKDTTLALLLAAQSKGWSLFYMEMSDLYLSAGEARGQIRPLQAFADPNHWYELGAAEDVPMDALDMVLMRKDPPFDNAFLYSTLLLEQAERQGVMVVNKPSSLRDYNEKLFATHFPQCCPPLVVSSSAEVLKKFHAEQGDVIFKPLDGMGGMNIYRVKADGTNINVILDSLTGNGRQQIMAQRYLPEIKDGDKRILMINGEPIPYALARIPAQGETRGNLAAGGKGEGQALSDRDRWICEQVGSTLKAKGLYFVGLDVIGDYLTEINVTSPTCVRELDNQFDLNIGLTLMDALEKAYEAHASAA